MDDDIQKLLEEMAEALQESHEIQEKYSQKMNELIEENKFLSETITKSKLGLIATERRELLSNITRNKIESEKTMEEAVNIRNEYENKLEKITTLIMEVKNKNQDIESYINSEAEKKIAKTKSSLKNKYKKKEDDLMDKYSKLKLQITEKLKIRNNITGIIAIIAIIELIIMIM